MPLLSKKPRPYASTGESYSPPTTAHQHQIDGGITSLMSPHEKSAGEFRKDHKNAKLQSMIEWLEGELLKLENICDGDYEVSRDLILPLLVEYENNLAVVMQEYGDFCDTSLPRRSFYSSIQLLEELGTYQDIENWFKQILPSLRIESGLITGLEKSLQTEPVPIDHILPSSPGSGDVVWLVEYIAFLAKTGRMLDFADAMTRTLPWLLEFAPNERHTMLYATVQILNRKSKYLEAANQITIWKTLCSSAKTPEYNPMLLQMAINKAGLKPETNKSEQERMESTQRAFMVAFVSTSIFCGPWHASTLEVLYYFGKTLREWSLHKIAGILQEECYVGSVYRFGAAHPRSIQALAELQSCKVPRSRLYDLKLFSQADYDREKKLSIAYEHIHLNTAVNLLQKIAQAVKISYGDIKYIAECQKSSVRIRSSAQTRAMQDRATRVVAQCLFQLKDIQAANKTLMDKIEQPTGWKSLAMQVERIEYAPDTLRSSKDVLQFCQKNSTLKKHQREAVYRRLTAAGHMHFTRDVVIEDPVLISEQDSEALGRGAFADVSSVKMDGKLYARKSVMLRRSGQRGIRNIFENEVSILRALDHPHVVRVVLTYEAKFHFYIVMHPLADCDLEAYLQMHAQKPPTQDQRDMLWKWMLCLSNTMAYIHFRNIRHKDIKPRNILVKGMDVIFADFGSGHLFLDDGHSTTEGPSFGHTKIYCAPEVLASGKRGRRSNMFSLGCVFTELAVWLAGSTPEKWNHYRKVDEEGMSNHTYSATLMQITRIMGLRQKNREVCGLYEWVIKPMLREESEERPTAVQVSARVISSYQHVFGKPEGLRQCPECRLEKWVDVDNAIGASVLSFDTGTSTPEEND